MRVGSLCIGVALGAAHLFRRLFMHQALHVFVAVHAREHAAVNGVLELALIDKEAHGRAVCVFGGESGIGVAGETVRVFELLRGKCAGGPGKNSEDERRKPEQPYRFHTSRRRRSGEWLP